MSGEDRHIYMHESLPVIAQTWRDEDGSWHVSAQIRGTHEVTIAGRYMDRDVQGRSEALDVLYGWMRGNQHPDELVAKDAKMRTKDYGWARSGGEDPANDFNFL